MEVEKNDFDNSKMTRGHYNESFRDKQNLTNRQIDSLLTEEKLKIEENAENSTINAQNDNNNFDFTNNDQGSSMIEESKITNNISISKNKNTDQSKTNTQFANNSSQKKSQKIESEPIIVSKGINENIKKPSKGYQSMLKQGQRYAKEKEFYNHIKPKLDELMDTYPHDAELETIIGNSKWAKVDITEDDFYVVGLIYEDESPKLICYGVPDENKNNPPSCQHNSRQWLELEKNGRGYWMMYQDAESGKTLTSTMI